MRSKDPMMTGGRPIAFALLVSAAAAVTAQAPTFYRGDGELLPPELRDAPSPLSAMADLTVPDYLWAFHREAMAPRAAPPELPAEQRAQVVAALLAASRAADVELRWQCLWALARIARDDAAVAQQLHARVADVAAPGGSVLEQQGAVGDVGCLAVGLAARADHAVLKALAGIANDAELPVRRRAYAFYGLGLAAQASDQPQVQFRVLAAVERALLGEDRAPDVARVAALHALAMLRVEVAPDLPGPVDELLGRVWASGDGTEREPDGGAFATRAHVPFAVAAMGFADEELARVWRERFEAAAPDGQGRHQVGRSCVLALGKLAQPWHDESSPGAETGALLQQLARTSRDMQTRYYALFAMGQAGGERNVRALEEALDGSFLARPWAAFGLVASCGGDRAAAAERAASIRAAIERTKHRGVRAALVTALAAVERVDADGVTDPAERFAQRYRQPLGSADVPTLVATVTAADAGPSARRAAALLGHLADRSPVHWSARLGSAIDYRNGTAALLGFPHGVLRLP